MQKKKKQGTSDTLLLIAVGQQPGYWIKVDRPQNFHFGKEKSQISAESEYQSANMNRQDSRLQTLSLLLLSFIILFRWR